MTQTKRDAVWVTLRIPTLNSHGRNSHFGESLLSVPVDRLAKHVLVIAVLIMGATGVRLLVNPALGSRGPLLIYTLAVAIAAQSSGIVAGLITTCLSALLINDLAPASDIHMHTALAIFAV